MKTQLENIANWLEEQGESAFRARQIEDAWYKSASWDDVTTLSKDLRAKLTEAFPWKSYTEVRTMTSKKDGSKKALLTLADGNKIETVYMPNARGGKTVCISSQVGCAMACTFCATGTMGLMRNLSPDEIVDQVRFWQFTEDEPITNIVFMGMGEPMANYEAVKYSAKTFIEKMEIGATRVTVSTVGVLVGLNKILTDDDFPPTRIALSLHAGTDETREKLVPTHKGNSLKKIVQWAHDYLEKKGNRRHHLTLEYVMLLDQNDMASEARAVVKHFGKFGAQVKLNLIPWNHTDADMQTSSEKNLKAFAAITEKGGIRTTIRYSKGLDIDAACGQLVVSDSRR